MVPGGGFYWLQIYPSVESIDCGVFYNLTARRAPPSSIWQPDLLENIEKT
jgi:hypothetical protein